MVQNRTAAGVVTSSAYIDQVRPRRALLAGGAAITALAAGLTPAADASSTNSDVALIGLCADLDAAERKISALFQFEPTDLADPILLIADAAAYRIDQDQRRILDRICTLTPATLDGYSALARSLALLCPGLVDTAPHADMEARLTSTLLRGLTRAA